jgi:hypothetical protein
MTRWRFVILEHDHPFLHWDFMLDNGQTLDTWRLLNYPQQGTDIPAEELPQHRQHYLDYEGPISNDRGTVTRIASGTFEIHTSTDSGFQVTLYDSELAELASLTTDGRQASWHFS